MAMIRSLLIFSLLTLSVSYCLSFPIYFTLFLICMPCSWGFLSSVCCLLYLSTSYIYQFNSYSLSLVTTCSRNHSPTQPSGESLVSCMTWSTLVPWMPQCLPFCILEYCQPGEGLARSGGVGFLHHSIQSSSPRTLSYFPFFSVLSLADASMIIHISNEPIFEPNSKNL